MLKINWKYFLLIIPAILGVLALCGFGFFFKSGTAGFGILLLLFVYFDKIERVKDVWMIIVAFLFSIAGDWFLSNMNGNSNWFVIGIALFFVTHIGYLLFALINGKVNWLFTTVLLAVFLIFYFVVLFPSINENVLKPAVLIYLLISCFSLGAATGIQMSLWAKRAFIFGIFLILFSDTIISFKEFVGYNALNFLILPTYYLAHILITFSLMKKELDT